MALSIETFTDTKSYTDTDCKLNGKSSSTNMGKSCARKFVAVPEALKRSIQATRAEYRQLGRSGLRVSNPILGGLQIGDSRWFPWILDEEKVRLYSLVFVFSNLPEFFCLHLTRHILKE